MRVTERRTSFKLKRWTAIRVSSTPTRTLATALFLALLFTVSGLVPGAHAFTATPVSLGTASPYAILAESGITNTGSTTIVGNVGLSPGNSSDLTGFSETLDASGQFSRSPYVQGYIYANNYKDPTPAELLQAVSDMHDAVAAAAKEKATYVEGTSALSGEYLAPGVYNWTLNLQIIGSITLVGNASQNWLFQVPGTLAVSENVTIAMSGGASYANVFWLILGQTDIGKYDNFQGTILAENDVLLNTGANLTGKIYAEEGVALQSSHVGVPSTGPTQSSTSSTVAQFPSFAIPAVTLAAFGAAAAASRRSLSARRG